MRTLLPDPPPAPFDQLLAERERRGADRRAEVWEGVRHRAPAPHCRHPALQGQLLERLGPPARARGLIAVGDINLGDAEDYRVPDAALTRPAGELFNPTAALAVEILSPNDETSQKLGFYAAHAVAELLIVDPEARAVRWLGLGLGERGGYAPVERSGVIDLSADQLAGRIDWPA